MASKLVEALTVKDDQRGLVIQLNDLISNSDA